jgi:hypothetical protein
MKRRRLLAAGIGASLALGVLSRAAASPRMDTDPDEGEAGSRQADAPMEKRPSFSDVARVEPWEALLYLAGKDRQFPEASLESLRAFSPANIIETMDTVVLDAVAADRGGATSHALYRLIANEVLEALFTVYRGAPVLLALDAGHGGRRGVYYDPGANGTEAIHTREVVSAIEERATDPRFARITIRRIFNDEIGDDFGLPPPEDRKSAASLTLRNVRASMLAFEVDAWNRQSPQAQVTLHVLSIHFNAGSGGILVLHQGDGVPAAFRGRSIAYAETYIGWARTTLNDAGVLPYRLSLALGTGLSDDHVLYEPMMRTSRFNPYTGTDRWSLPRRYAMLQDSPHQQDYALGALIYHGLI